MFSSTKRDSDAPGTARGGGNEARLSVLAAGTRIVGELETDGVVKIEGELEGSVRAQGQVLVAKGGLVKGDIATRQAIIAGEVHGGVFADERVELQATSHVEGDITAPRIVVEEGGRVNGHIKMANPQVLGQPGRATKERERRLGSESANGPREPGAGKTGPLVLDHSARVASGHAS
jgi:cytoskeletal protein CcmA (bactofilin family)